jgi:hypothetical protein
MAKFHQGWWFSARGLVSAGIPIPAVLRRGQLLWLLEGSI